MSSSLTDKNRKFLGKRKKIGHEDTDTTVACYFSLQNL